MQVEPQLKDGLKSLKHMVNPHLMRSLQMNLTPKSLNARL